MSNIKEKVQSGTAVCGTMLSELYTPNIVRVLKGCGFDYIIIDCEHGYFDYVHVANIIATAKGINLDIIIRIPNNERTNILKYMDMGATGLMLPMTNTVDDINQVINYAKYAPIGNRGISTARAHNNYDGSEFDQYMKDANESTLIFAQIETKEGLRNIDEILKVNGVYGAFVGPNDLSADLGVFGEFDHEKMKKAIKTVSDAAKDLDKPWGIISSKIDFLTKYQKQGMKLISCGSEIGMIAKQGKKIIKDLEQ